MTRQAKAMVCRDWTKPAQVETISVARPKRNEITIKVAA